MAAGVADALPGAVVRVVPVADGGEGTVDVVAGAGAVVHRLEVSGPTDATVTAALAVRAGTAFLEAAQACGLQHVEPDATTSLGSHSRGVGQLLRAALDLGCRTVVVGLGGSACTDAGAGMLSALGAALLDADGAALPPGGGSLHRLHRIDLSGLDPRLAGVEVVGACDVRNVLAGRSGAAHVFAPQKGAGPDEVRLLDRGLRRWARVVDDLGGPVRDVGRVAGGGASGGVGAALVALCGARLTSGATVLLDLLRFRDALDGVDVVVTGEGRLDRQSLGGKAPQAVARAAVAAGASVIAVAGQVLLPEEELRRAGFGAARGVVDEVGAAVALGRPAEAVRRTTTAAVRAWSEARHDTAPAR